ncbi:MAG TPA: T9SS type A sorting domain-containing protein [Flavobacteriales bacterium]|nr:T9SS type A sorting domain-containing protein [Flavobacteriales bacterium]
MMNSKILFALLGIIGLGKIVSAQTAVSGGIYTNTTWTLANSPYLMTNNIVVFPGVTLTIEPGVEVRVKENGGSGTQYYLETRGTINMVGTSDAPITFRADTALTTIGAWQGIIIKNSQGASINYNYVNIANAVSSFVYDGSVPSLIQLNKCNFSYNANAVVVGIDLIAEDCVFLGNETAIYGWANFTFRNCVFDDNNSALFIYASSLDMNNCVVRNNSLGIGINSGSINGTLVRNTLFENNILAYTNANNGLIDSCTFIGNTDAVTNTTYLTVTNSTFNNNGTALQVGFGSQVNDCLIEQNQTGVAFGPISFGQPMPVIENNRICSNALYNIDNRTDLNIFIPTNCFCTTDSTEIETKIFDGYDDITKGLVGYAIFDTSCSNVLRLINKFGVPTSLSENEIQENINVFPNPVIDQLTILNNNSFSSCSLITMDGKEVLTEGLMAGNTQISMSQLPAGIYFLVLRGAGQQSRTKKVVHL